MSLKPPARDPNAPKRNQSAYLLYQNQMRNTFKEQNPGMTFGQLSKFTSAMYAQISPEEKEVWLQHAEADKQRYLRELDRYEPPPGYDRKGDLVAGLLAQSTRSSGGVQRDPKAPKKNLSAYLMYQNAMRETFRTQFPAMTFGQLSRHTSQEYKNLSEEERDKWKDLAALDKKRYEEEIAKYEPPPGHDKTGVLIASKEPGPRRYAKKEKDPDAPKRARGSFVYFTLDCRPEILKEFPDTKFTELGHLMGQRWRALAPDKKKKYEDLAQQDKKRFQDEMKEYNEAKAASMAAMSPPVVFNPPKQYGQYQQRYQAPMFGGQPNHAEQVGWDLTQYYQNQYDTNAATANQQYMDYYTQPGYAQAYPHQAYAQHQQTPHEQMPYEQEGKQHGYN